MIRTLDKAGSPRWAFLAALLALVLLPSLAGAQSTQEKARAQRERQSLFNLAAGPSVVLQVNQYQCGLVNTGDTCTDVFDSPTGGGGFWPTGSANQYMFNSGLQVTGIIPKSANFAWAGDTTGAFFMDASGLRQHGTAITNIYNSLDAEDLANWPTPGSVPDFPFLSGIVDDTALYAGVLLGRKTVSQQDTWVAYWDGDPAKSGGRTHPMGIVVEQRSMAWSYPAGNEASIFFIYRFTNATNNPRFQALNEAKYGIQLPDQGWRIDSIYASFDTDPDVGPSATNNYATGIMPFDMGLAYIAQFYETSFIYPTALFHPPFFTNAPGISGFKFLRSPVDPKTGEQVGLTALSQHTNGGAFSDPQTVQQGWRYLSLNVDAGKGDPSCSFDRAEVLARKACYLAQTQSDVRVFIASGPFSLGPGESATIAVMMYAAATVQTPEIQSGPNADNKPGVPSLAPGCNGEPIRPIEKAAGYIGPKPGTCPAPGEKIDQFDVNVVPGSLLGKALVAQSVFDNKFLLGFAPETPGFYLVPGNNQVSVIWEPSKTDVNGDPFFNAAGDPNNPLYDPNYRKFDVEGYRIYRGTTPANLKLIAQFDKGGTLFEDVLCMTDPTHVTGAECDASHGAAAVDIVTPFVQYTDVKELASGDPIVVAADTALAALVREGLAKPLENTGVPYAYIDRDVRNGFQYFYKVTAFDINSVRSGPTSLESAAPSKSVTPREDVSNMTLAGSPDLTVSLVGGTTTLNPNAALPTVDANNGTFSGKMPPTNGLSSSVLPYVARLFGDFTVTAQVDSVIATGEGNGECFNGSSWQGTCWIYYTTWTQGTKKTQSVAYGWSPIWVSGDASETEFQLGSGPVPYDPTASQTFGIPATAAANATITGKFGETIYMSSMEGQKNRRLGNIAGGSRWFSGANETVPDPTTFIRVGHLDGVDSIWSPVNHTQQSATVTGTMGKSPAIQCFPYLASQVARAADFEVTWTGGKVSVKDVTHNVDVPFKAGVQASYGFLNADANGNGKMDWDDFQYIDRVSQDAEWRGFCEHTHDPAKVVFLSDTPQLKDVSFQGEAPASLATIGKGIAMYINGQIFFFKLNSLPADGTKWNLRMYSGNLTAATGAATADPSGYAFSPKIRPPMVPGLKVQFTGKSAVSVAEEFDLTKVHTVPDPYYANSLFDQGPATKEMQFVNLPTQATIRIYSMAGVLVDIVNHNDPTGGSIAKWDLRNRSKQFVASGVYFFHVSTPDGKEHVGKFTVVNSGFAR